MPNKTQEQGKVVMEFLRQYPTLSPTTIAELIVIDPKNEGLFKDKESARSLVRYYKQLSGEKNRKKNPANGEFTKKQFDKAHHIESDKKEAEFDYNELLDHALKSQELYGRNNLSQAEAEWKIKSDKPIYILFWGDQHIGATGMDIKGFRAITQELLNTENVFCILLGDIMEMAIKMRSVHEVMGNMIPPKWQFKIVDAWLSEIQHKVICATWDNHCFSDDTEVLTNSGYKLFSELTYEDLVAQYDEHGNVSFDKPKNYIQKYYVGEMYEFDTFCHNQLVTPEHRIITKNGEHLAKDYVPTTTEELYLANNSIVHEEIDIEDDMLKLITWVAMDGTTLYNHGEKSHKKDIRIQFKLSKQAKIDYLISLLTKMNIPFTFKECKKSGINVLQPYYIRIYGEHAKKIAQYVGIAKNKSLPETFRNMSKRQLEIVLAEISRTDGRVNSADNIYWSSTSLKNISIITECCLLNGIPSHFKEVNTTTAFYKKPIYLVSIFKNYNGYNYKVNKLVKDYSGMVYCVEMPKGTVVTRRNGKSAFSGNCIMREENVLGWSPTAEMLAKKVIYHSGIGHIDVKVNDITYKLAVSHFFKGNSIFNPNHELGRYIRNEYCEADIVAQGDRHTPAIQQLYISGKKRTLIKCGTHNINSGYAKRFYSLKTFDDMPVIRLDPKEKLVTPFMNIKEANITGL